MLYLTSTKKVGNEVKGADVRWVHISIVTMRGHINRRNGR